MKITILSVGKIKEKYFRDAVSEYQKRLGRYCDLQIVEFPDEKTKEGATEKEEELVREKEGARIQKYLDEHPGFFVTLEIEGKSFTSPGLANKMQELFNKGESHIIFLIGGSLGISQSLKKRSQLKLSFSDLTFPHQLMRVILLEQIYRSFRILNNEPYHK